MNKALSRRNSLDGRSDVNVSTPRRSRSGGGETRHTVSLDPIASADVYMENILIKLELLNYRQDFCKQRKPERPPLHRMSFVLPPGPLNSSQFSYFVQLVVWLIGCLGREISPPKEFDDPSIVCADLMNAIKLLGFPPPSFSATKLHKGYGPELCCLLDALLERVLKHRGVTFHPPVFPQQEDEDPEEEEDEEMGDAEIAHDEVGSIDDSSAEEESIKTQEAEEGGTESSKDPEAWRIETARVATKLKIHPSSEVTRHWRQDLDQAEECLREMLDIWEKTERQMTSTGMDISRQLERIQEKEERMQHRFGLRLSSHAEKSKRIEEIQVCLAETELQKGNAEGQLKEIEMELQQITKHVEEKSSSLSDTSPVVQLKEAIDHLKHDLSEMHISIALMSQTLCKCLSDS